jgi:hypothetical protein
MAYDDPYSRRTRSRRYLAIIGAIAIIAAWLGFRGYRAVTAPFREIEAKQRLILYHTNHAAIVEACKFIRDNRATFKPDPNWNPPTMIHPDPTSSTIPKVIRDLHPHTIVMSGAGDGTVGIEMGGGFYHYGLTFAETKPAAFADKQVAPNLWFYSEDGKMPPP